MFFLFLTNNQNFKGRTGNQTALGKNLSPNFLYVPNFPAVKCKQKTAENICLFASAVAAVWTKKIFVTRLTTVL